MYLRIFGGVKSNYYCYYHHPNSGIILSSEKTELQYYEPLDSKYSIVIPWGYYSNKITKVKIVNEIKPINTSHWFLGMTNLTNIEGLANINTSNTVNMDGMFEGCKKITSLDLRSFNTENVTSMSSMFRNTKGLNSLNLSSFDTSKVTDMSKMFMNCGHDGNMEKLDLSSFNTSSVKKEQGMFHNSSFKGRKLQWL